MTIVPLLALIRIGKIGENSLDYSIYNAAKQALWLPTTREQKYVAKQAIDTFVVRTGDFVAGILVAVGAFLAPRLAGSHIDDPRWTKIYTITNVVLAVVFLGIVVLMGREHKKRAEEAEANKSSATEAKEEIANEDGASAA
jgi:AAA family ATP:ADP antiporter